MAKQQQNTDLPSFKILADGKEISTTYHIRTFVVNKEINRIANARIVLTDGDPSKGEFGISDTPTFIPGVAIEIKTGYKNLNKTIFKGIIVKISIKDLDRGLSSLVVDAKDQAYQMTLAAKSDYFYNMADSDIIQQLTSSYGMKVQLKPTNTIHSQMVQCQVSDWEFIVNRAEKNGSYIITDDGTLVLDTFSSAKDSGIILKYGLNILQVESEIDSRLQRSTIQGVAWDPSIQSLQQVSGQPPSSTEQGNLKAETLAQAGKVKNDLLSHSGTINQQELQAWASARLEKTRLAKVRSRIKVQGNEKLKPGQLITIQKLGKRFTGPSFISGVRHTFSDKNWETDLQLGVSEKWHSESLQGSSTNNDLVPNIQGLYIGKVTQLQGDPQGEERIQVKIPIINNQKPGIWAKLALIDAGTNRGAIFRPDIGDEVILGFINNDPRYAVILGSFHSSAAPSPIPASDTNPEKGFITRTGLKVVFDDQKAMIKIASPGGNQISIDDQKGGISIEDQNTNKVVLNSNGISLESSGDLSLKSSGNISIEGQKLDITTQNFSCQGSAGVEIISDASTSIKGSLVEIN